MQLHYSELQLQDSVPVLTTAHLHNKTQKEQSHGRDELIKSELK